MNLRRPAPLGLLSLSLLAAVPVVGCAKGGDTSPADPYPETGGGGSGASDAAPDATGGSAGSPGSAGTSGTGGLPADASVDTDQDAPSDVALDGADDGATDTTLESGGGLPVGEPCTADADCSSGFCKEVGTPGAPLKACIRPCLSGIECPAGTRCTSVPSLGHVCAPYHDEACALCTNDDDCHIIGNQCLTGAGGQQYCAVDCSFDNACPVGLQCQTVSGKKLCVQPSGQQCPCAPNRDGETRPCENHVNGVVCHGSETCDGQQSTFVGCTALTPSSEVCNGVDDDCNGTVDDLPHATCSCSGGTCSLVCNAGYAHYPDGLPESDGCPCPADAHDGSDGGACASPHTVTAVADVGGTPTVVTGTLSSDTDEDWFRVTFNDVSEANANSFHASISLTSNPNGEFVFVVVADCAAVPSAARYTSVDDCVNYLSGGVGLSPCGDAAGQNHCAIRTMTRTIGVLRNPAAPSKTCASYTLSIAAAGPCDTSSFDGCVW